MNGYTKNKLDKMAKIEHVTFDLLSTLPIKKIAVTDISKTAGVSKVTIFNYYETKQALIKKVIFDHFQTIYDQYEAIIQSDLSFEAIWVSWDAKKFRYAQSKYHDSLRLWC